MFIALRSTLVDVNISNVIQCYQTAVTGLHFIHILFSLLYRAFVERWDKNDMSAEFWILNLNDIQSYSALTCVDTYFP